MNLEWVQNLLDMNDTVVTKVCNDQVAIAVLGPALFDGLSREWAASLKDVARIAMETDREGRFLLWL